MLNGSSIREEVLTSSLSKQTEKHLNTNNSIHSPANLTESSNISIPRNGSVCSQTSLYKNFDPLKLNNLSEQSHDSKESIKNRTSKVNNQRKFKSEQLKDLFSSSEVVYKRFSKEQCSEIDVQIISAYDLLTDSDYWEAEHDFNEFENHQMQ